MIDENTSTAFLAKEKNRFSWRKRKMWEMQCYGEERKNSFNFNRKQLFWVGCIFSEEAHAKEMRPTIHIRGIHSSKKGEQLCNSR